MTHKIVHKRNGKRVTEAEFHRAGPVGRPGIPSISKTYSGAKPLVSQGAGCLPNQVPEMREFVKEQGLSGVDVRPDGSVAFSSRGDNGRRGLLRARGLVDNDGGFGD